MTDVNDDARRVIDSLGGSVTWLDDERVTGDDVMAAMARLGMRVGDGETVRLLPPRTVAVVLMALLAEIRHGEALGSYEGLPDYDPATDTWTGVVSVGDDWVTVELPGQRVREVMR